MSKKISIEVGHGGSDPGAISGSILEKNLNLSTANFLKTMLERNGLEVLMSRTKDEENPVRGANGFYEKARAWKPDIGIAVHTNAFNGTAQGFEVFRRAGTAHTANATRLCQLIETEVIAIGQRSRGVKDSGFLMDALDCPTAFIEMGFLDNPIDYARFDNPSKRYKFAEAYAKGIVQYLGLKWIADKEQQNNSSEPAPVQISTMIYRVQVGAFSVQKNAENYRSELIRRGIECFIVHVPKTTAQAEIWRVQVGAFSVKANAENYCNELKKQGIHCFVA